MATKKSDEIASIQGEQLPVYDRNQSSFSDWFDDSADEIQGNELVKDDILKELEGVPFGITRLTFRKGIKKPGTEWMSAYVTAEAVIADQKYLDSRKRNLDDKPFLPGDHVVLNDGSTGIYRQLVAYLEGKGYIELPQDMPTDGPSGKSRYDLPPSQWTKFNAGEYHFNMDADFMEYSVDIRLRCPRGLRISDYTNDFGDAETHYLA